MHLSSTGSAAYGYGTVSIDGSVPGALAGQTAGAPSGPSWLSSTKILYQSGGTGSGPWIVQSYDTGTLATATVDASPANVVYAGNSVWAAFLSGLGVRTSLGGHAPFASSGAAAAAGLGYVSTDGQFCMVTTFSTGIGLTVYDDGGSTLLSLPTAALVGNTYQNVRANDGYLTYLDANGWHLVRIADGSTPRWYPRIDGVVLAHPVVVGASLWMVELNNTMLTIRNVSNQTGRGFVVENAPDSFWPTARLQSTGVVRVGFSKSAGEATDDAVLVDVTVATGANTRGVVTGGSIVFTAQTAFAPTNLPVGPAEGSDLTNALPLPLQQPVVHASTGLMAKPWSDALAAQGRAIQTVGNFAQAIPAPTPPPAGFGIIAASGQPNVPASAPDDTLTLSSADASIVITTNPATKTADLSAASGSGTRVTMGCIARAL